MQVNKTRLHCPTFITMEAALLVTLHAISWICLVGILTSIIFLQRQDFGLDQQK